jgi:hypothetical protein
MSAACRLEAFVAELCVLGLLLQMAVLCVSVAFEGTNRVSDRVELDTAGDEDTIDPVLKGLLPVMVEFPIFELEDTKTVPDSVALVTTRGGIVGSTLLEVFETRPCEPEILLAVVVRFPSVELSPTFGIVELATTGDSDTSSLSLEALETWLWVATLLLIVMLGCTSVGTNADDSTVEFATAADVCGAFEESNIVVVEFDDRADSFAFEVDRATLAVLGKLLFPETFDVMPRVKVVVLDAVDAMIKGTRIEFAGEVLGAPDKVSESEGLSARLFDQLSGPLKISPVAVIV